MTPLYTFALMRADSARALAASRKRRYERRCKERGITPLRSGRVNAIQVLAAVALPTLAATIV